ncbi:MAG: biopolymer transporter ExbD [Bdellovibrionaceae bacterium]|nr:biopolymer transporter ExbD [Pseudobdellovibrionaceae bacterium]NUM57857.1 biopolymer transporter ExbD [Pseudobdellovibrionaceae bacterium]
MDFLSNGKKKYSLATLQLAPIIDVFIIIIIFFILGSFSNGVAIEVPSLLKLPTSDLSEKVDISPEVILFKEKVQFKFIEEKELAFSSVRNNEVLINKVKTYLQKLDARLKINGTSVNLIIDEQTDFKSVYDISTFLRQLGFENLSFITLKEYRKEK